MHARYWVDQQEDGTDAMEFEYQGKLISVCPHGKRYSAFDNGHILTSAASCDACLIKAMHAIDRQNEPTTKSIKIASFSNGDVWWTPSERRLYITEPCGDLSSEEFLSFTSARRALNKRTALT
jgi:hypothetical protein